MSSKLDLSPDRDDTVAKKDSKLSTSAGGLGFSLVGLSSSIRALTFLFNQILLRQISPELLGISTQLEVYSISVLFFARESLRVAVQREAGTSDESTANNDEKIPDGHVDGRTAAGRTQAVVNLSYLSINLGVVFAVFFAALYHSGIRSSDPSVLQVPYFGQALKLYGLAAVWELLSEPCFVVVQQKQQERIGIRAAAEFCGTFLRCLVTCGSAFWASRNGRDLGVLPFALGQGIYAISLSVIYYWRVWGIASTGHFSLFLRSIYSRSPSSLHSSKHLSNGPSNPKAYLLSYFSWPLLTLSGSFFTQGIVKHFLTEGDTFMIGTLASTRTQGMYALAANYGGLVARIILRPIEEDRRNYFGGLLSSLHGTPSRAAVEKARSNLQVCLQAYILLSLCVLAVGPTLAPLLLKIVAGSKWTTSGAGNVLATYCYYIPLLAINGLTEAFVSSVATEKEIHRQSIWMLAFSAGFGGAAFVFLRVLDMGAEGLVWANVLNMVFRIVWSADFVRSYMKRNGTGLELKMLCPDMWTVAAAVGTALGLEGLESTFTGDLSDVVKAGGAAGVFMGIV